MSPEFDAPPPADDIDPGPPISELAGLSESPSSRFVDDVLDGVNRRQASSQLIEVVWWGWTSLLFEFVQGIFKTLGIHEDTQEKR